MPDNSHITHREEVRINIDHAHEVRYWKVALDCTEEQLRKAVATVGPLVTDVRAHLRAEK
jgi:hypothetical protein